MDPVVTVEESDRPLILVVDDDADVLALVAFSLERAGYDVDTAADGEEALALAREHHPDLVVLDVMMPRLDGYGVARALRAGAETNRIPLVFLTARSRPSDRSRGVDAGADDYVCKPFSPRDLSARVQTRLAAAA
jgi:DNA-binding response OmpR family regulator